MTLIKSTKVRGKCCLSGEEVEEDVLVKATFAVDFAIMFAKRSRISVTPSLQDTLNNAVASAAEVEPGRVEYLGEWPWYIYLILYTRIHCATEAEARALPRTLTGRSAFNAIDASSWPRSALVPLRTGVSLRRASNGAFAAVSEEEMLAIVRAEEEGTSAEMKVGIIAGSVGGALLLAALITYYRRKPAQNGEEQTPTSMDDLMMMRGAQMNKARKRRGSMASLVSIELPGVGRARAGSMVELPGAARARAGSMISVSMVGGPESAVAEIRQPRQSRIRSMEGNYTLEQGAVTHVPGLLTPLRTARRVPLPQSAPARPPVPVMTEFGPIGTAISHSGTQVGPQVDGGAVVASTSMQRGARRRSIVDMVMSILPGRPAADSSAHGLQEEPEITVDFASLGGEGAGRVRESPRSKSAELIVEQQQPRRGGRKNSVEGLGVGSVFGAEGLGAGPSAGQGSGRRWSMPKVFDALRTATGNQTPPPVAMSHIHVEGAEAPRARAVDLVPVHAQPPSTVRRRSTGRAAMPEADAASLRSPHASEGVNSQAAAASFARDLPPKLASRWSRSLEDGADGEWETGGVVSGMGLSTKHLGLSNAALDSHRSWAAESPKKGAQLEEHEERKDGAAVTTVPGLQDSDDDSWEEVAAPAMV